MGKPLAYLLGLMVACAVLAGIGVVVYASRSQVGEPPKSESAVDLSGCLGCHGNADNPPVSESDPGRRLYVDEAPLASSVHEGVDCASCHSTHDEDDAGRRIEGQAVIELCGRCHRQEQALQARSVHSDAHVATCLDCHNPGGSGHAIQPVLSAQSPVYRKNVAATCGKCHADEALMARYGLKTDVFETYMGSPHAKALRLSRADLSALSPATCATCHGSHDAKRVDDRTSPVRSAATLAIVCARCHSDANESFARSLAYHQEPSADESPLVYYGERFFFILTTSVVGLGLLMVGLEGFGWLTGRGGGGDGHGDGDGRGPSSGGPGVGGGAGGHRHVALSGASGDPAGNRPAGAQGLDSAHPSQEILRFEVHQRAQHFLMMACFLVLAFTGLPQKFSEWGASRWLIDAWGGLDSARAIHRFAGLVMLADCVYHLGYVAFGSLVLKKPLPIWMIPAPKDIADFFQDLQFWFGHSSERPKFGRFSYREKFDYWAIFWGMPVIGLSGLMLMFPTMAARFLPGDMISVAFLAHSDEAVLAVLWIFVVHFFFVHFNPRFFPLNRSIFTGKMQRRLYAEEHPLELAAIDEAAKRRAASSGDQAARARGAESDAFGPAGGGS
ncbi:MAG: cytochrome c3 family protein [Dehalococcoidia bacterium]|nr:cytochrome c3 family protein [Dehalococcoidia bacterium]